MYLSVQGLVLRVSPYNETDAMLTLITCDHGLMSVKARGLRRKNSSLIGPCQLLAFSEFVLFENRGFYTINEARTLELFHSLRKDLVKLSLGTYFAQATEVICQEDIPNPELMSTLLNCLYALSKLNQPEQIVKAVFELRVACIAGYTPDLSDCVCGKADSLLLDLSEGRVVCSNCAKQYSGGIRIPLSSGTLASMRYICECESKRLFAFKIGEKTAQELADVTEAYLVTQLERGFSTLDFYKTLLI